MTYSARWLLLSLAVLLLAQDSIAETAKTTVGCWHHYCTFSQEPCQRPLFYCGRKQDDDFRSAHACKLATPGTVEPPDMYCTSSHLMVCGCGHKSSSNDKGYTVKQAFCDCQLSEVGKLILTCVLVPLFVIVIAVCFLVVFRRFANGKKCVKQQDVTLKNMAGNVEDA